MTTLLGKLLVLATTALSLLFLGIALGLYTNRINYPGGGQAQGAEAVQGELTRRQEEIKGLKEALDRGRSRFFTARADLAAVEKQRPEVQRWYEEQLVILRTGKNLAGQPVAEPVRMLTYKNGRLVPDRTGAPTFEKLDFPPLDELRAQSKETEEMTLAATDELKKKLAEENRLGVAIKGTRALAEEEQTAWKNSHDQLLNVLAPMLYDEEVKSQALVKRQRALAARVAELKGAQAARQP